VAAVAAVAPRLVSRPLGVPGATQQPPGFVHGGLSGSGVLVGFHLGLFTYQGGDSSRLKPTKNIQT